MFQIYLKRYSHKTPFFFDQVSTLSLGSVIAAFLVPGTNKK